MATKVQDILSRRKALHEALLNFLDSYEEDGSEKQLKLLFDEYEIRKNKNELKSFLIVIVKLSKHHSCSNLLAKIFKLIISFKEEIIKFYPNFEIINLFKSNRLIILFLIKINVLKEGDCTSYLSKYKKKEKNFYLEKRNLNNYLDYFTDDYYGRYSTLEEIINKLNKINSSESIYKGSNKEIIENLNELIDKVGVKEEDEIIYSLIKNDSIDEFISYINEKSISLEKARIDIIIYNTNLFLEKKQNITLIECAAFFGSIRIFQYLKLHKINMKESLWFFAIHGNNPEIIKILEDETLESENNNENNFILYFKEAIKCHHNDVAFYILNNYLSETDEKELLITYFKYHNYLLIEDSMINKNNLCLLCKYDYYDFVKEIIDSNLNDMDSIDKKIFDCAVLKSNFDIINLLLSYPQIDYNFINFEGNIPLHLAVSKENIIMTKILLSNPKIDINHPDNYRNTPIYYAIETNNMEIFELLLSNPKIDVNWREYEASEAPIYYALERRSKEMFKLLLSHPKININNPVRLYYNNILHAICESYIIDENDFKEILKMPQMDVNRRNSFGDTPLHTLLKNMDYRCRDLAYRKFKLLIECPNINVNLKNNEGRTPLHIAFEKKLLDVIEFLLSLSSIDVNIPYIYRYYIERELECSYAERTVLEIAIAKRYDNIVQLLLSRSDIDVNVECKLKTLYSYAEIERTIIDVAIKNYDIDMFKTLILKLKADETTKDKYVEKMLFSIVENEDFEHFYEFLTDKQLMFKLPSKFNSFALYHFTLKNDVDMVKKLLENENIDINYTSKRTNQNLLEAAVNLKHSKILELLLSRKEANINQLDKQKNSLLINAIRNNDVNSVRILMSKTDIDINYQNPKGKTPIELAIVLNNLEIIKLLLESPKINTLNINQTKMSSLQVAIGFKNLQIIELFLSRPDVDINYKDINGNTALIHAVSTNNFEVVKLVLSVPDININSVNLLKISALQIAVQNNNLQIVQLLLSKSDIDINIPVIIFQNYVSDDIKIISNNKEEKTVLYLAIQNNNFNMFTLLLSHKNIDVNAKYKLNMEYKDSYRSIYNYYKEEMSLLNFVIEKLKTVIVIQKQFFDALISNPKIDVNSIYFVEKSELNFTHEKTPLYQSIEQNNIDFVNSLLSNTNIDVNLKSTMKYNQNAPIIKTPLHLAVLMSNLKAVKSLLECKNIDIDAIDENGKKPIQLANNNSITNLFSK